MVYHLSFELSFVQNTFPGRYYALEGIDGSGKTTQAEKLGQHFKNKGKKVLITKEPSNSPVGLLIKEILHKKHKIPSLSLQYLFAADRGVHLESEVIPALKSGITVISDRSFWSAAAYGIADLDFGVSPPGRWPNGLLPGGRENKHRLLVAYNILSLYHGFLVPDKTFVIHVTPEIAMNRVTKRKKEQTLYEKTDQLAKVAKEYQWLAEEFGEKLVLIDGTKNIEEVFGAIKEVVYSM